MITRVRVPPRLQQASEVDPLDEADHDVSQQRELLLTDVNFPSETAYDTDGEFLYEENEWIRILIMSSVTPKS